ncbi:hypothetical protein G6F38_009161 [Rhizopus arrhizus]|nr:hypothetical protein G6F38_009161 [Rhizopus arrhizus]
MTPVSADNQGSYTVPGLGKRRQQIMRHGGQVLATAMLETDTLTTNYTDGDGKPGDSAHFGIFQQNWLMLRAFTAEFKHPTAADHKQGTILKKKLMKDTKARQESEKHYGTDKWFGGHRNGETGLNHPYTHCQLQKSTGSVISLRVTKSIYRTIRDFMPMLCLLKKV